MWKVTIKSKFCHSVTCVFVVFWDVLFVHLLSSYSDLILLRLILISSESWIVLIILLIVTEAWVEVGWWRTEVLWTRRGVIILLWLKLLIVSRWLERVSTHVHLVWLEARWVLSILTIFKLKRLWLGYSLFLHNLQLLAPIFWFPLFV